MVSPRRETKRDEKSLLLTVAPILYSTSVERNSESLNERAAAMGIDLEAVAAEARRMERNPAEVLLAEIQFQELIASHKKRSARERTHNPDKGRYSPGDLPVLQAVHGWSTGRLARELGIPRKTLLKKMRGFEIVKGRALPGL